MTLSIVIPAHNAADTLAVTLDSVLAQTRGDWQVVVVDDGSTDATAALVRAYEARDARIRLLSDGRKAEGVSAARNRGIAESSGSWLLFLDADDTIEPPFIESMVGKLEANPGATICYCACRRMTPDGGAGPSWLSTEVARAPFEVFARQCPVVVHGFVLDRALVMELGGFDTTLRTSEDWDFWQRLARTGASFLPVAEPLANYHMRGGSLSSDVRAMIPDARIVIERAFGPDPRVPRSAACHALGADPAVAESKEMALGYFALSCAAVDVGQGGIGLDVVLPLPDRGANVPEACRAIILDGLMWGMRKLPDALPHDDPDFIDRVRSLLQVVERAASRPGLARFLEFALEPELFRPGRPSRSLITDRTIHVRQQIGSLRPIAVPGDVDTLHIEFREGVDLLARTEAPVFAALSGREVTALALEAVSLSMVLRKTRLLRRPTFWLHAALAATRISIQVVVDRLRRRSEGRPVPRLLARKALGDAALAVAGSRPATGSSDRALDHLIAEARAGAKARAATIDVPRRSPTAMSGEGAPQAGQRRAYWEAVYRTPDPWAYGSPYEQTKYRRTLQLLPPEPIARAMELACSEGRFTAMLAPRVGHLTAADISRTALERARDRCRGWENIDWRCLDLFDEELPGGFDLVVCSEVLYDLPDRNELARVCRRLADTLAPGGRLLAAHAFVLKDDPSRTGFDWDSPFGAKVIAETLGGTPGLVLERSLQSELYRVDLFRQLNDDGQAPAPVIEKVEPGPPPEPDHAYSIVWGGAVIRRADARATETTDRVPILMYHRIASDGPPGLDRYRTLPERFAEQMQWLRCNGYHAIGTPDLARQLRSNGRFAGRPVMITFDDGYRDFHDVAWPILRANDLSAEVMLVTDRVGGNADWDSEYGPPAPLMDWREIQYLAAAGVRFGSHLASHRHASTMTSRELAHEAAASRTLIEHAVGVPCIALAAPFGDNDGRLVPIARRCGYTIGLTTNPGHAGLGHDPMRLPRVEVLGDWSLDAFVSAVRPLR